MMDPTVIEAHLDRMTALTKGLRREIAADPDSTIPSAQVLLLLETIDSLARTLRNLVSQ